MMFKAIFSIFFFIGCIQSIDNSSSLGDKMGESASMDAVLELEENASADDMGIMDEDNAEDAMAEMAEMESTDTADEMEENTSVDAVVDLEESFAFSKEIRICAVSKHYSVWCAVQKNKVVGRWKRHTGKLTHVTIHGDHMFGVNKYDNIYYKPYNSKRWTRLHGKVKQVHFDGTSLCAVNAHGSVYCATKNLFGDGCPNWFKLKGKLNYVVVKNRDLLGVNAHDNIYRIKDYGALNAKIPSWTKLWGRLKTVSMDEKTMCGINVNKHMYCSPKKYPTNRPKWHRIVGKYVHVEIYGDQIFATLEDGSIQFSDYPEISWTKIRGNLKQISITEGISAPTSYNNDMCKN